MRSVQRPTRYALKFRRFAQLTTRCAQDALIASALWQMHISTMNWTILSIQFIQTTMCSLSAQASALTVLVRESSAGLKL